MTMGKTLKDAEYVRLLNKKINVSKIKPIQYYI